MGVQIEVAPGAIIQRDAATYTAGERLEVSGDEARDYVKGGQAVRVADDKK